MREFVKLSDIDAADAGIEARNIVSHIDELCTSFFHKWCERHSLIPLAYLMHGWPITKVDSPAFRRLSDTLKELVTFHRDALTDAEWKLASELLNNSLEAARYLWRTERNTWHEVGNRDH